MGGCLGSGVHLGSSHKLVVSNVLLSFAQMHIDACPNGNS